MKGAQVTVSYSNSNGSIREDLVKYNIDTDFPGGANTPLTERKYLQDLRPSISPGNQFNPLSKVLLTVDISEAANVTIDATTVIEIPARRKVADAPGKAESFKFNAKDFGLVGAVLQPGKGKNVFFYQCDITETIRLGQPSESPLNMNNSTILMDLQKV